MASLRARFVIRPLAAAFRALAVDTAARLGGGLGVLAFHLGVRRRLAAEQLTAATGQRGARRARTLRRSYASIGATFFELLTAGGVHGVERALHIANPRWLARLQGARRGLVLVTPHLGSWDAAAAAYARNGRLLAYAKQQHDVELDAEVNAARRRLGFEVLLAHRGDRRAAVAAVRALRAGDALGLVCDQRPSGDEGEPAWFLARAAWCASGPGFFGSRGGVVVPAVCLRRRAGELILFVGRPLPAAEAQTLVQLTMDCLGGAIVAHPGQYFWQHRRHKGASPPPPPRPPRDLRRGLRLLVEPPSDAASAPEGSAAACPPCA